MFIIYSLHVIYVRFMGDNFMFKKELIISELGKADIFINYIHMFAVVTADLVDHWPHDHCGSRTPTNLSRSAAQKDLYLSLEPGCG